MLSIKNKATDDETMQIEQMFDNIQLILHNLSEKQMTAFLSIIFFQLLLTVLAILFFVYNLVQIQKLDQRRVLDDELAERTIAINEIERVKLARDLHDGLAQELVLANLYVDKIDNVGLRDDFNKMFRRSFKEIQTLCSELQTILQDCSRSTYQC
jgi:signal transduction histidine kinase